MPGTFGETLWTLSETGALALTIFVLLFSKFLWKLSILRTIGLVKYPNLQGTWRGEFISARFNERFAAQCNIKQDAWTLSWKVWHEGSVNVSRVSAFKGDEETQDMSLLILYENKIHPGRRKEHGQDHEGACILSIEAVYETKGTSKPDCPWRLHGRYWTNKLVDGIGGSTGNICLEFAERTLKPGKFPQPRAADSVQE